MAASSSVRDALRRINEILYDYDNISVDVVMRDGKITITADVAGRGSRSYTPRADGEQPARRGRKPGRKARARGPSGQLPGADEILAALKQARAASMTALARKFGVKPRQRLKEVLGQLLKEGKIRKSGLNFVLTEAGGGAPKRGPGRPPGPGKKAAAKKSGARRGGRRKARGRPAAAAKAAGAKPTASKPAKVAKKKRGRPAKQAKAAASKPATARKSKAAPARNGKKRESTGAAESASGATAPAPSPES